MFLWELGSRIGDERLAMLVALHLDKWGTVTGAPFETPNSRIYRIQAPPNAFPRQFIAKAPWFDPDTPRDEVRCRMERFAREAENTIRVADHPFAHRFGYITFIHHVPFLISACRDGTLEDLINAETLSLFDALVIGLQLTRGLAYCQRVGLVAHQDLKPANILFEDLSRKVGPDVFLKYHARVADFELSNAYIELGIPSGSRPYMSPEQHEVKHASDQPRLDFSRSDVFSFGVLLHEMVTSGMHPVGERTRDIWPEPIEGKNKWKRSNPWREWINRGAPIQRKLNTVPAEIYALLEQCLKVDPKLRPALSTVEEQLWMLLPHHSSPDFAQLLRQSFDQWEATCVPPDSDNSWPYGEEMLEMVRRYYSQL